MMEDAISAPVPDATIQSLRTEIRAALVGARDVNHHIEKVLVTSGEVIGVRIPDIRAIARDFVAAHPGLDVPTVRSLLDAACATRCREEMLAATFMLARDRRAITPDLWPSIDRWIESIDNWEMCDQLATGVAGEIVALSPALVDDLVTWTASANRWRRRFAASTTVALSHKGRRDAKAVFRVCRPLLADRDSMVVKAVGWALRDASKHNPEATFRFLLANLEIANRRTVREAAEKLSPDQRALLAEDA